MAKEDKKQSLSVRKSIQVSLKTLKLVWNVDKGLCLLFALFVSLPGILPFVNIYIYKLIINFIVNTLQTGTFHSSQLISLFVLRLCTYFLQQIVFVLQSYVQNLIWTKFPIYLNTLLFTKFSELDVQYFEDSNFQDLLSKVRDSYNFRPQNLINNLFFSLQSFIQVIIAFFALLQLSWLFLLPILLVTVPDFYLQLRQSKVNWNIWSWSNVMRKRYFYLAHLMQNDQPIKELKIFGLGKWFVKTLVTLQKQFYKENKKVASKFLFLDSGTNFLQACVFVGIEIYVIFQVLAKKLTIGDIGFYTGVVTNFQNGIGGLFRTVNQVYESSLYVVNIFELLDLPPLLSVSAHAQTLQFEKPPTIEFRDVTFGYKNSKKKILEHFSLTIMPGEKIAFVGENGAGKSTLIKLLVRFYDPNVGQILINGIDIRELDIANWHQHVGVLFQDFNRYEYTVKENIQFGQINATHSDEKIADAAKSSGAAEVIEALDKKFEQMLGKTFSEGIELSTGQWQKLALARAFYRNAPVLVLDEPTSAIDAKAEAEIFSKVEKLSKDKTVIIISHRFSTVRNADRIVVIDKGKIIEEGSHEKLMKEKGLYAELFEIQAKGYK